MIRHGDRLKYFRYKYVIMDPFNTAMISVCILLICIAFCIREYPLLAFLIIFAPIICLIFKSKIRCKRLNDYLIMVKIPFDHCFYLYQSIKNKGERRYPNFEDSRSEYLLQMSQVLDSLPSGCYKTITQPIFTRAICQFKGIRIVKKEKAYRKNINILMQQVHFSIEIPKHCSYTQFYYLEFERNTSLGKI